MTLLSVLDIPQICGMSKALFTLILHQKLGGYEVEKRSYERKESI